MRYKRSKLFLITVAVSLTVVIALAGCATTSPARQVLVACQGYASTLTVLAARRAAGKLSDTQVELVNILRPGLNKICLDGNFTDPTVAYDLVQDGMFRLIQLEVSSQ